VTLLGHDFDAWWVGCVLSVEECRRLVGGHNSTTLQVALGLVGALVWILKNPNKGLCLPDEVDHEDVMNFAYPYLDKWVSEVRGTNLCLTWFKLIGFIKAVDFNPLKIDDQAKYVEFGRFRPAFADRYQFKNLLIKQDVYSEPPQN